MGQGWANESTLPIAETARKTTLLPVSSSGTELSSSYPPGKSPAQHTGGEAFVPNAKQGCATIRKHVAYVGRSAWAESQLMESASFHACPRSEAILATGFRTAVAQIPGPRVQQGLQLSER